MKIVREIFDNIYGVGYTVVCGVSSMLVSISFVFMISFIRFVGGVNDALVGLGLKKG